MMNQEFETYYQLTTGTDAKETGESPMTATQEALARRIVLAKQRLRDPDLGPGGFALLHERIRELRAQLDRSVSIMGLADRRGSK
jgi:hypothetical protein